MVESNNIVQYSPGSVATPKGSTRPVLTGCDLTSLRLCCLSGNNLSEKYVDFTSFIRALDNDLTLFDGNEHYRKWRTFAHWLGNKGHAVVVPVGMDSRGSPRKGDYHFVSLRNLVTYIAFVESNLNHMEANGSLGTFHAWEAAVQYKFFGPHRLPEPRHHLPMEEVAPVPVEELLVPLRPADPAADDSDEELRRRQVAVFELERQVLSKRFGRGSIVATLNKQTNKQTRWPARTRQHQ